MSKSFALCWKVKKLTGDAHVLSILAGELRYNIVRYGVVAILQLD